MECSFLARFQYAPHFWAGVYIFSLLRTSVFSRCKHERTSFFHEHCTIRHNSQNAKFHPRLSLQLELLSVALISKRRNTRAPLAPIFISFFLFFSIVPPRSPSVYHLSLYVFSFALPLFFFFNPSLVLL